MEGNNAMIRELTLTTIIFACLLSMATAQDKVLVDITDATTLPDIGPFTFHNMCEASSTWCTSRDILRSGPGTAIIPEEGVREAWVQPSLATGNDTVITDFSGISVTTAIKFTCQGWSAAGAASGLIMNIDTGIFALGNCPISRRVACCAVPSDNGGVECIPEMAGAPCTDTTNCCSGIGNCTGGNPGQRTCQP